MHRGAIRRLENPGASSSEDELGQRPMGVTTSDVDIEAVVKSLDEIKLDSGVFAGVRVEIVGGGVV